MALGHEKVLTSADGITWERRDVGTKENYLYLEAVTHGAEGFVVVGRTGFKGRIFTSPDGIEWTARHSESIPPLTAVAYGARAPQGGQRQNPCPAPFPRRGPGRQRPLG